jgi:RNA polymerase sigma factor (TIGR02999 family)
MRESLRLDEPASRALAARQTYAGQSEGWATIGDLGASGSPDAELERRGRFRLVRVHMDAGEQAESGSGEVTRLLGCIAAGDETAWNRVYEIVLGDLRRVAGAMLRRERAGHTLQTLDVVNDAFVRLVREETTPENRGKFLAIAALAMRRILVDHARRRGARKRGEGIAPVALPEEIAQSSDGDDLDLVAVDEALVELERLEPELASLVNLRFFAGLSEADAALALGLSERTVQRRWIEAKSFLSGRLRRERP